jgi:prepilin-type N-terminal cleavage/methylation domain-containing protein
MGAGDRDLRPSWHPRSGMSVAEKASQRGAGGPEAAGFSLVEVIIAIFLLAIIAIALLPALWQGVGISSQQSATATATRHLYGLIEQARSTPTCSNLSILTTADVISDGKGQDIVIDGTYDSTGCSSGAAVAVSLAATNPAGVTLARVDAQVYIP